MVRGRAAVVGLPAVQAGIADAAAAIGNVLVPILDPVIAGGLTGPAVDSGIALTSAGARVADATRASHAPQARVELV
jgi:hypothetical protein